MSPGILATILILLFSAYQLKAKPTETSGKLLLKLNTVFGFIGVILMVAGTGLTFLYQSKKDFVSTDFVIMVIISCVFVGVGFWTLLVYKNHYVLYDTSEILVVGLNKSKQTFSWEDISDLKFNRWSNNYILTLKSGEKVKIYKYLSGSNDFIKKAGKL